MPPPVAEVLQGLFPSKHLATQATCGYSARIATPSIDQRILDMSQGARGRIPPPIVLAINVCEDILLSNETATLDLYRCFTSIVCREFPAFQPSIFVHLDLTNGRGSVELKVALYPIDHEESPIVETSETVFFDDPRNITQICFELGAVEFTAPGEHLVTVHAGHERIAERRIVVFQEE